ncbi:MAG TPA: Maf family protein [Selenomonadales bacterium]|nr:Maf family protein [Selenomonadales bacterium]
MEIILASASPRREELLRQIDCKFTIITSDIVEDNDQDIPPEKLAVLQAKAKALDVAARKGASGALVIGADTIVVGNNRVYGKPRDEADAERMLQELQGRDHQVISGVAVVYKGEVWTDYATTRVALRPLSPGEIKRYVATGEPLDKAGAYAIQGVGALLVEEIAGSYTNVVGLPLTTLNKLLHRSVGVDLL